MQKAVTLAEIEKIFAILEPLGISREAVVIPLRPEHPGRMRRLASGKFEIVVEREDAEFDEWLRDLDLQMRAMTESRSD